jgi:outer membrane lipoprotein-sorting protein
MRTAALSDRSRRRLRWAAPVVAGAVMIGVGPLVDAVTANAHGSLPPRTAAQLLVDVQQAKVKALSGTVVATTDLGLPQLPTIGGSGGGGDQASFSSLVSGSHTMRVWYDGPDRIRLALLGQLGESDLVRNGADLWAWSSGDNTATHWTVPTHQEAGPLGTTSPSGPAMTPQQAAEAALKAIDPSTRVAADPGAEVAGRSAYQLDLVPRDSRSLIGSVRIAIDGSTHIPTRVQVFARGASSPAFQVGYTSFSTATPPSSVFGFRPPPGATVKQGSLGHEQPGIDAHGSRTAAPQVLGKGWTSVVVAHLPQGKSQGPAPMGLLKSLPAVSGSWGSGHLLRSSLLSVVLTDDGRIAVGAVAPQMLYDALSHT